MGQNSHNTFLRDDRKKEERKCLKTVIVYNFDHAA